MLDKQTVSGSSTNVKPQVTSVDNPVKEIPQYGMWIGFLYILYFISLYVWATSFGSIVHEIVNRYISDALELEEAKRAFWGYGGRDLIIKWSLSALVVFYPFFAIIHILTERFKLHRQETVNIRVRKILIYITLIGTFLISGYQLSKFVNTYLNGIITFKTFVHFAVTTTIAGSIFIYYFLQIRKDKDH